VAEAEYSTTTPLPVDAVWRFVEDMDNWARFVTGYQRHEKQSEVDSTWTLKGDLGVMSRTLTFQVHITEWAGPRRVAFELAGVNEPMRGEGSFTIEAATPAEAFAAAAAPGPALRRGAMMRPFEALWRWLLRAIGGRVERAESAAGAVLARLSFRLRLDPGGPMAPMVNAMIKPMMRPAAEDLANRILAHLEAAEGARR
jgi:carbon monoxide dehydrogenase subunit G